MTIKLTPRLVLIAGSILLSSQVSAQDSTSVNTGFYGGIGIGGAVYKGGDFAVDFTDITANAMLGYEEKGWTIEAKATKSKGTLDTSNTFTSLAVGYRTIENNGRYYKFKVGEQGIDDDEIKDGSIFGIGVGFRTGRDSRIELEYEKWTYKTKRTDFSGPVHMFSMNYLFGGAPYSSRNYTSETPLYAGVSLGITDPDIPNHDNANTFSTILGYSFGKDMTGLAAEFVYSITSDTDADLVFLDSYEIDSYGLYAAYRTPGKMYFKGRLGYNSVKQVYNSLVPVDDAGASFGIGAGYILKDGSRIEVDITQTQLKNTDFSLEWDPISVMVTYIF